MKGRAGIGGARVPRIGSIRSTPAVQGRHPAIWPRPEGRLLAYRGAQPDAQWSSTEQHLSASSVFSHCWGPTSRVRDWRRMAKDAEELVAQSITAYKAHHRHVPARVVVLTTSRFRPEVEVGIDAALKESGTELADLLWVQESSPIAVFRDGNYPVLRGTLVDLIGKGLLYTCGSVFYYGTYPGLSASLCQFCPKTSGLKLRAQDGPGRSIERSEMANERGWFDQKLPAPIKAAREVGRILMHIGSETAVSPDFRKYT